jgi:hypothetical protein
MRPEQGPATQAGQDAPRTPASVVECPWPHGADTRYAIVLLLGKCCSGFEVKHIGFVEPVLQNVHVAASTYGIDV